MKYFAIGLIAIILSGCIEDGHSLDMQAKTVCLDGVAYWRVLQESTVVRIDPDTRLPVLCSEVPFIKHN